MSVTVDEGRYLELWFFHQLRDMESRAPTRYRAAKAIIANLIDTETNSEVPGDVGVHCADLLASCRKKRRGDRYRSSVTAEERVVHLKDFYRALDDLVDRGLIYQMDEGPGRCGRSRGHPDRWYRLAHARRLASWQRSPVPDLNPIARAVLEENRLLGDYQSKVDATYRRAPSRPVEQTVIWLGEDGAEIARAIRVESEKRSSG